jgi:tetratricopeptide (TPR) repeat protein
MTGRAARLLGVAGLLLGLGLAAAASAETRLTIDQGRALAIRLVQAGQATAARDAARALLQRDPDDVLALIVLSRAERDLGAYKAAQKAARHAARVATKEKDRFAASLAMAQALSSDGRRTAAQFWLRRAMELAPDDQSRAVAVRDFTYVRSRNPVSARLSFGAFPSSNVNDGPTSNTLIIGGIEFVNPDAVPLSGLGFSLGGDLSWRMPVGEKAGLTLGLSGSSTRYILSEDARRQVPDARAGNYATSSLSVSVSYDQRFDKSLLSARLETGRDWLGGEALADWTQLTFGLQRGKEMKEVMATISESISAIAMIILIIGGGGAFKQVLVDSGVDKYIAAMMHGSGISPLVLAWGVASALRLALGSATVAAMTTAGIVAPIIATTGVSPELMVIATGAGSVIFSHVNDPGFWIFKEYFNLSIPETFKSWSILETLIAVCGLAGTLILSNMI